MLTVLGGGVLVLATAGVAWAAFGTSKKTSTTAGNAPQTVATAPGQIGPVIPGARASSTAATTKVTPSSVPSLTATAAPRSAAPVVGPVLATAPATKAPAAATTAPTKAAAPAPTTAPTKVATVKPVTVAPARTAPQAAGAHTATSALHYTVTSRSTLWDMTVQSLRATHRATDSNTVSAYVNKLYAANRKVIGADKDLLYSGEVITWPAGL